MKPEKPISKPILFSADSIRGIIAGKNKTFHKTQTRRIVKPQPNVLPLPHTGQVYANVSWCGYVWHEKKKTPKQIMGLAPFQPGDWLYIKQTYYQWGFWNKNGQTAAGQQLWKFIPSNDSHIFYFDTPLLADLKVRKNSYRKPGWYKRNALFMPRSLAQHFIMIKSVRMERIQSISRNDAAREGVCYPAKQRPSWVQAHRWPEENFETLWINMHGRNSWYQNVWVWVYEFEYSDLGLKNFG